MIHREVSRPYVMQDRAAAELLDDLKRLRAQYDDYPGISTDLEAAGVGLAERHAHGGRSAAREAVAL